MNQLASAAATVETSLSTAAVITAAPSAELDAFRAKTDELKPKVIAFIRAIVAKKGPTHTALAKKAVDHSPAEIATLLSQVGVSIDQTTEAATPYLPMLQSAKDDLTAELEGMTMPGDGMVYTKTLDEVAAPGKPAKAPKAPKAAKPAKEPKAPKAAKEPKAPKAPKEPKAAKPAEVPVAAEVKVVDAASHKLPEVAERAKLVPLPAKFFLEVGEEKGSKVIHQVDPTRAQGYAPVMPNLALLAASGNAYPDKIDETVKTSKRYEAHVLISHNTFAAFSAKAAGVLVDPRDASFVAEVVNGSGINADASVLSTISDTLRDMTLYGLATQFKLGRTRLFTKAA